MIIKILGSLANVTKLVPKMSNNGYLSPGLHGK